MQLQLLHHIAIRTHPDELKVFLDFYRDVLGMHVGPRSMLKFPGYWLYLGEQPVVHLQGNAPADEPALSELNAFQAKFNHVCFSATGIDSTRERLQRRGIEVHEQPVRGCDLYQMFFRDPGGLRLELNFFGAEARKAIEAYVADNPAWGSND
jgi:catechol 2,3-dioxygenase-like lactoylglutathione lyase family enzyme